MQPTRTASSTKNRHKTVYTAPVPWNTMNGKVYSAMDRWIACEACNISSPVPMRALPRKVLGSAMHRLYFSLSAKQNSSRSGLEHNDYEGTSNDGAVWDCEHPYPRSAV
jgi:hypothetical protein